jgi:hypothetical protein
METITRNKTLIIYIDYVRCIFSNGKLKFYAPTSLDVKAWRRINKAEIRHYKTLTK